jgi:hypothetical protein
MTREQLKLLNDDELAMLWFIINKSEPPVLRGQELEPQFFCSIKENFLKDRIQQVKKFVKSESIEIYDSLCAKLEIK